MEQFIINYTGQKYKESCQFDSYDFSKYNTVVEPFGGSFGFSRYLYQTQKLKNINYIIYDNNKELIDFYKSIQQYIKNGTIQDFINEYNSNMDDIGLTCKNETRKYDCLYLNLVKKKIINMDTNMQFMILNNIGLSFIPKCRYKKNVIFLDMIENITFIHEPFNNIDFEKYNNENTLIYFDPPYLNSFNGHYKNHKKKDTYPIYESIKELMDQNYNIILVHIFGDCINSLFEKYFKFDYTKYYQVSRNNTKHAVYSNNI
jgi:site-specific DNA-adenine methylase